MITPGPETYSWTLVGPTGSLAELDDPTSPTPWFTPDVEGSYFIVLEVSDFIGPSASDFLDIIGSSPEEFAEVVIVDTSDAVDQLEPSQITTEGNAQAFTNYLSNAIESCQKGKDEQAKKNTAKCNRTS